MLGNEFPDLSRLAFSKPTWDPEIYHGKDNVSLQVYGFTTLSRWWFQILFIFIPNLGEMIQVDAHIFQMGWFNHLLLIYLTW